MYIITQKCGEVRKFKTVFLHTYVPMCTTYNIQHTNQNGEKIPYGYKIYKIYQIATKYTKWLQNTQNGFKIYEMDIKYTQALQNLPQLEFLYANIPSGYPGMDFQYRPEREELQYLILSGKNVETPLTEMQCMHS
jgi:hypothetical protein